MVEDIVEDSNNEEDDASIINNLSNIPPINYDCVPDPSYNPDFM